MAKATDIGQVLATLRRHLTTEGAIDNVSKRDPVLDMLRPLFKRGSGASLFEVLEADELDGAAFTDASGTFSTDVSKNIYAQSKWDWALPLVNPIRIRRAILEKSHGKEALVNLTKGYLDSATRGQAKKISSIFTADAADVPANTYFSFDQLTDPTVALGGIDPSEAGNEFWAPYRNYAGAIADLTDPGAAFMTAIRDLADGIEDNGGTRDGLVYFAGTNVFRGYENYLDDKVRYTNLGKAETRFKTVEFDGTLMRRVPNMDPDTLFGINLDKLNLRYANEAFLEVDKAQAVPGTLDEAIPVFSILAATTGSRRSHGALVFKSAPVPEEPEDPEDPEDPENP